MLASLGAAVCTLAADAAHEIQDASTLVAGDTLYGGCVYYVTNNIYLNGSQGNNQSALIVSHSSANSPAVLMIAEGVTLTVYGADGYDLGAGAGIEVSNGQHLLVTGAGTLIAKGGDSCSDHSCGGSGGYGWYDEEADTMTSGYGGNGGHDAGGEAAELVAGTDGDYRIGYLADVTVTYSATGSDRMISGQNVYTITSCPNGYVLSVDSSLTNLPAVARISSEKFASLADAFSAAQNTDKIELLSDVMDEEEVAVGGDADSSIILDLAGHTLSNALLKINGANLILKDTVGSGMIIAAENSVALQSVQSSCD